MVKVTAAVIGCDMTTLGLFKEWSPAVPITPNLTFHISNHLSGPPDRSQFNFLLLLLSYTHTHTPRSNSNTLNLTIFVPLFHFNSLFHSLLFFFPFIYLLPITFLHGVCLQGIATFLSSSLSCSIWQLTKDQKGSKFLIPETCPSVDTPLPLAEDPQLQISHCCKTSIHKLHFSSPAERLHLTGRPAVCLVQM